MGFKDHNDRVYYITRALSYDRSIFSAKMSIDTDIKAIILTSLLLFSHN